MSLLLPEKFPVKFYSWKDQDAPQLQDVYGCIKTILKACLVTGYGDKESAGWTSLFEDDYRIVLRRPLRTGNPPDVKIENGIINGVASHRIVLQYNPGSIDDTNEKISTYLNARDKRPESQWYLMATDFAFILCYQMLQDAAAGKKNYALFVGGMQNLYKTQSEVFCMSVDPTIMSSGISRNHYSAQRVFDQANVFKDVNGNTLSNLITMSYGNSQYNIPELLDGEYCIHRPILHDKYLPPYFLSVGTYKTEYGIESKIVTVAGRKMLRYVNMLWSTPTRIAYIPIDYWEL